MGLNCSSSVRLLLCSRTSNNNLVHILIIQPVDLLSTIFPNFSDQPLTRRQNESSTHTTSSVKLPNSDTPLSVQSINVKERII